MNIDYEAIAKEIRTYGGWVISLHAIESIIDAYEAQKAQPEWVPLDLEKVQQGWEVRHKDLDYSKTENFVCVWNGSGFITEHRNGSLCKNFVTKNWLMREPKPKTVKVEVRKGPNNATEVWIAGTWRDNMAGPWKLIGEGEIEVRE